MFRHNILNTADYSNNAGSAMLATHEPYTKAQAHHKVSLYLTSRAYES